MEKEDLKKWFEVNYLDGDEIQGGQTLSSEECFDAVYTAVSQQLDKVKKAFGGCKNCYGKRDMNRGLKDIIELYKECKQETLEERFSHIDGKTGEKMYVRVQFSHFMDWLASKKWF